MNEWMKNLYKNEWMNEESIEVWMNEYRIYIRMNKWMNDIYWKVGLIIVIRWKEVEGRVKSEGETFDRILMKSRIL